MKKGILDIEKLTIIASYVLTAIIKITYLLTDQNLQIWPGNWLTEKTHTLKDMYLTYNRPRYLQK